jgi:hypothetical protein
LPSEEKKSERYLAQQALRLAEAEADREFNRVRDELDGRNVVVRIGKGIHDSRVWVNDKPLRCFGVEVAVEGSNFTRLTLKIAGTHLSHPVIAEGVFTVESVIFADEEKAMADEVAQAKWKLEHPPKLYRINDYAWVVARHLNEAINFYCESVGRKRFEVVDKPAEVTMSAMELLTYTEDDGTEKTFAEKFIEHQQSDTPLPFLLAGYLHGPAND